MPPPDYYKAKKSNWGAKKTTSKNSLSLSTSAGELYSCIIVIKKLINNYLRHKQSTSKKMFTKNRLNNVLNNFFNFLAWVGIPYRSS